MTSQRAPRDAYALVGSVMRDVLHRAARCKLTPLERRVLDAVLAFTVGWSKLEDRVHLAQLAAFAFGVDNAETWMAKKTREALRSLGRHGLVDSEAPKGAPGRSTPRAYRIAVSFGLDPDHGATSTNPDPGAHSSNGVSAGGLVKDPDPGPQRTPELGSANGVKDPDPGPQLTPGSDPLPRTQSEKVLTLSEDSRARRSKPSADHTLSAHQKINPVPPPSATEGCLTIDAVRVEATRLAQLAFDQPTQPRGMLANVIKIVSHALHSGCTVEDLEHVITHGYVASWTFAGLTGSVDALTHARSVES